MSSSNSTGNGTVPALPSSISGLSQVLSTYTDPSTKVVNTLFPAVDNYSDAELVILLITAAAAATLFLIYMLGCTPGCCRKLDIFASELRLLYQVQKGGFKPAPRATKWGGIMTTVAVIIAAGACADALAHFVNNFWRESTVMMPVLRSSWEKSGSMTLNMGVNGTNCAVLFSYPSSRSYSGAFAVDPSTLTSCHKKFIASKATFSAPIRSSSLPVFTSVEEAWSKAGSYPSVAAGLFSPASQLASWSLQVQDAKVGAYTQVQVPAVDVPALVGNSSTVAVASPFLHVLQVRLYPALYKDATYFQSSSNAVETSGFRAAVTGYLVGSAAAASLSRDTLLVMFDMSEMVQVTERRPSLSILQLLGVLSGLFIGILLFAKLLHDVLNDRFFCKCGRLNRRMLFSGRWPLCCCCRCTQLLAGEHWKDGEEEDEDEGEMVGALQALQAAKLGYGYGAGMASAGAGPDFMNARTGVPGPSDGWGQLKRRSSATGKDLSDPSNIHANAGASATPALIASPSSKLGMLQALGKSFRINNPLGSAASIQANGGSAGEDGNGRSAGLQLRVPPPNAPGFAPPGGWQQQQQQQQQGAGMALSSLTIPAPAKSADGKGSGWGVKISSTRKLFAAPTQPTGGAGGTGSGPASSSAQVTSSGNYSMYELTAMGGGGGGGGGGGAGAGGAMGGVAFTSGVNALAEMAHGRLQAQQQMQQQQQQQQEGAAEGSTAGNASVPLSTAEKRRSTGSAGLSAAMIASMSAAGLSPASGGRNSSSAQQQDSDASSREVAINASNSSLLNTAGPSSHGSSSQSLGHSAASAPGQRIPTMKPVGPGGRQSQQQQQQQQALSQSMLPGVVDPPSSSSTNSRGGFTSNGGSTSSAVNRTSIGLSAATSFASGPLSVAGSAIAGGNRGPAEN